MEALERQQGPPWAAHVVLSVTGVPKAERTAIQALVERAGGSYSPNLSRRCTHLAVPGGVSERSEKLRSALRNRHKWGLHIVDLRWVLDSAQAGQRLHEGGFPVHPLPQEQAPPAATARRPADSWAGSGNPSEQAADTYKQPQGHGGLPPATVAAAAARAARPANPLRNSVNSRPLSSFVGEQTAPSLQTQAPSAGRSVRWAVSDGSPSQWGAPSGAAAAAHAAAAAVLPGQVEQRCLVQQETDEEADFSKLPMTQAGFIPAADLLEQLRASNAGLLPAEPPAQPPPQPAQQEQHQQQAQQQQQQVHNQQQTQQQQQQHGRSPAGWQPQQPSPARYAWQGSPQPAGSSSMQVDAPASSLSPLAAPSALARQGAAAATSTADLLQQLRLSIAGQQPHHHHQQQQLATPARSTAELLEQLRQPPAGTLQAAAQHAETCGQPQNQQQQPVASDELLQQLRRSAAVPLVQRPAQQAPRQLQHALQAPSPLPEQQTKQPGIPTSELLQQLRSSAAMGSLCGAAQQQVQPHAPQGQPQEQQQGGRRLATEDLLAALRAAPDAGQGGWQQQQQQPDDAQPGQVGSPGQQRKAPATADLLRQLQAAQAPAANQKQQQAAPATADLLRQLQAVQEPAGSEHRQAKSAAPATADLLQQLQPAPVPAGAADAQQRKQATLSTASLLQHLQASGDALSTSGMQRAQQAQHAASGPQAGTTAAAHEADITGLLQQLQQLPAAPAPLLQQADRPAAADVPVVQADVAAAAASRLADQMRSLLQDAHPAAGMPAAGLMATAAEGQPAAGTGRSTEELLALLRRQQEQRPGSGAASASSPAAGGGVDELLSKLRSMAPQASFTPLRQHAPTPAAQQAVAPPVQQGGQPGAAGPASEDEDMPPAKYQRQGEPERRAPAAFGAMPVAQAATATPATPAAEAVAAGDGGGSLAPTVAVSGGNPEGTVSPSGSVPASSAGSPPLARQPAGTPAAPVQADEVSPAGSGSGKPDAASSQVAESCRVFGGMLAIVDPSLPAEEQQRVVAALEQGGGQVAASGGLARGVTHVVCQPDQALKWLSMGVGIVSPAWVLQSLRTGKQQRCLMVSADASRHLPAASATTHGGSSQQPGSSETASGSGTHGSVQQLSGALLASKEARQQALMELAGQGAAAVACAGASTPGIPGASMPGGHRPAATPAELLVGVLWSVLEPPHMARLEGRCGPHVVQEEEEPIIIIPDSEDEEEQARLCCISASQAAVADVLCEAAGAEQSGERSSGADPAAAAAAWQQDVVLQGPAALTLLLPRDARGQLGSDTRSFAVPAGRQARELTAAQLLGFVHAYYAEEVPPAEQLSLLKAYPAAEGAAAVLRPAFLELRPLARGALLGPRCAFEGLRKATRDPAGAVYEVLLGS